VNLAILLANSGQAFGSRPALTLGSRVLFDYRTLALRAASLAGGLRAVLGLRPGDRVALAMKNCPEYLEILFACWHAGLVAVPMNAKLHSRELGFMANDCGARAAFATEDLAHGLSLEIGQVPVVVAGSTDYHRLIASDPVAPAEIDGGELAWIFYTSGTTGSPKGAMLSHRNLFAMLLGYLADVDGLDKRDALLHLAATSHASGLFALSFIARAANNILPESGGYDPPEFAAIVNRTESLTFFVPPTLLRRMTKDETVRSARIENIRTILVGAAPVYAEDLIDGLAAFGPRLWNGYGQGETPCTITAMSKRMLAENAEAGNLERLVSVGIARTGIEVRVCDDGGAILPTGATGEVLVRGETVMAGYWNRPDATAEALRGGWLHTGDLGRLDAEGYLTLLDRKKDLIISGGSNIYAREIEDVLMRHPEVAEAAVVGMPDAEWGESVVAFVVPAGPAAEQGMLDSYCLEHIARFKRPKRYEFVAELPKNAAGKVLKRELRERLAPSTRE
jgi:long-chain acyl-CoA synthetase